MSMGLMTWWTISMSMLNPPMKEFMLALLSKLFTAILALVDWGLLKRMVFSVSSVSPSLRRGKLFSFF